MYYQDIDGFLASKAGAVIQATGRIEFEQGGFIYRRADETTKKFGYSWL